MRISPEYVATLRYMLKAAESQLAAFKSGEKYVRMEEEFRKQLREKDTIIKYFQHTGHIQPAFSLFLTLLFTFSSFKKQSFCYFPSMLIAFFNISNASCVSLNSFFKRAISFASSLP